MSQDQQTYRHATHAVLIGLVIHVLLTLTVLLLGLYTQSPAIQAAAWHLGGGLAIWCVLGVLYNQHRLERIEALEAEQFSQTDDRAAALFEDHAEDLHLARRRLNQLYKWGLGVVSLVTAGYLLITGTVLLSHSYDAYQAGSLIKGAIKQPVNTTTVMVVMAVVVFIAFIVARYESGMTTTVAWRLLRGGAGYLIGNSLVAVLVFVGMLFVHYGSFVVMGWLRVVIPILMLLIGLEIFLTLVLNSYRPRRRAEATRPAFDSRMLGWMTSPGSIAKAISEAVNYQFGFEVSGSWFYQLLSRAIAPLIGFGVLTLLLLSSLVIVAPHEQAVITHFGRIRGRPVGPGLHLKMPWPIDRAYKYAVGRVHQIVVGSVRGPVEADGGGLWTDRHGGSEEYLMTAPTPLAKHGDLMGRDLGRGASGISLMGARVVVQYRLIDLMRYITAAGDQRGMLSAIAERRTAAYFLTQDIDTLLGSGRVAAGGRLREQIQKDVDAAGLGLGVVFVGLNRVYPPAEEGVAAAFLEQIGAMQERQSMVEQARQEAIEALASVAGSRDIALKIDQAIIDLQGLQHQEDQPGSPLSQLTTQQQAHEQEIKVEKLLTTARGQAAQIIYEALADRWQRAVSERAMADRFSAEVRAYRNAPNYYRAKRYLDTLAHGLVHARKYILAADQDHMPIFRVDLKDSRSTLDAIFQTDE